MRGPRVRNRVRMMFEESAGAGQTGVGLGLELD